MHKKSKIITKQKEEHVSLFIQFVGAFFRNSSSSESASSGFNLSKGISQKVSKKDLESS